MTKTEKTLAIITGLILVFLIPNVCAWITIDNLKDKVISRDEMVIDLQQKLMAKDDSLDVFNLNLAEIQAQNEMTKAWVEMDSFIPDTLDSEGGE